MRDARLCPLGDEVKDGGTSGLRAGAGCRGDCNKRMKGSADRKTLSERGVDKIEEIGIWAMVRTCLCATKRDERLTRIACVEVHQLCGVNHRSTADCQKCIGRVLL